VKIRANYKCEYPGCNATNRLNAHHIYSRSNYSVRWSLNNGVCLCSSHHSLGNFSIHKAPINFIEWLRNDRGEDWYEDLKAEAADEYNNKLLPQIEEYLMGILEAYHETRCKK